MVQMLPGNAVVASDETEATNWVSLKPHGPGAPHTPIDGVSNRILSSSRARLANVGSGKLDWTALHVRSEHDVVLEQDLSNRQNKDLMPKQRLPKPRKQPLLQHKINPCSEPGKQSKQPLILYCGVEACASGPCGLSAEKSLHFQGHVHFARWIFAQRRGAVTPWSILIASWREAKPCAMAIAAARTGCCDGLRLDDRRPQLRKCSGTLDLGQLANVAVSGMIVILADGERTAKAVKWVQKAAIATKLPFHVCDNGLDLVNNIPSVAQGFREFHKRKHEHLGEEHLVKPTDPVEPAADLPEEEEHAQLAYMSPRQMRPAYAPANASQSGVVAKAMPVPMYIELNPWLHESNAICP
jgi:hypothetical protein